MEQDPSLLLKLNVLVNLLIFLSFLILILREKNNTQKANKVTYWRDVNNRYTGVWF